MVEKIKSTIHFIKNVWKTLLNLCKDGYWVGRIAHSGKNIQIQRNVAIVPQNLYMEDFTRLQNLNNMISYHGKVIIKKYAAVGCGCVLIPGAHTPTVGVPQFLSTLHINDVDGDLIIEEDAWVGAGSILLSHCHIGRGAVIGAGSLVAKPIPPYAVAVGSPAKVIAAKFSIEQILQHEAILYPPEDRMSKEEIEELFEKYYKDKKTIGTSTISQEDLQKLKEKKEMLGMTDYSNL